MIFLQNLNYIKQQKNDLLTFFTHNKVSILKGPTGCGKSTYIPYILQKHSIVLVEPRRIAVKSIYNSLKNSIEHLSYKMRFDSYMCKKLQKIRRATCTCKLKQNTNEIKSDEMVGKNKKNCFCVYKTANVEIVTDGIFLNDIDRYLLYDYIIVDEVHERSAKTDLILGILKQRLKNKLILMSATINTQLFEKYFDGKVFTINGQSYKADIYYESVDDYITASFLKIKEIVNSEISNKASKQNKATVSNDSSTIDDIFESKTTSKFYNNKSGDILVFLTGEEDINELYKLVRSIPQIKAYKIYSQLSDKKQNEIFEESQLTKVILSTNICETSITIPGIKYVIDCGLVKEKIYDGCSHLGIKKIGKDNADQRKGRCNRTNDGICYRLYEEETYRKMKRSQPEIEKCDLTDIFLTLMYYKYSPFDFEFITYPNIHNAKEAILYLLYIKAIEYKQEKNTFEITKYGKRVIKNPVDVKMSHFLEICDKKNILQLGYALVSIMSQEHIEMLNIENNYESDIEEYLAVFQNYLNEQSNVQSKYSSIQKQSLEKAKNIYVYLSKNKAITYTKDELYELECAYSSAFSCNMMIRQENGTYNGKMGVVNIFPSSNFYKKRVNKIVCASVWNTKKCYAQFVGRYITE